MRNIFYLLLVFSIFISGNKANSTIKKVEKTDELIVPNNWDKIPSKE